MAWFRTAGGRLIHGEGGLAAVYAARGWETVEDEQALAEVTSGEAQIRADVEADEAAKVDDATRAAEEDRPKPRRRKKTTVTSIDEHGTGMLSTTVGDDGMTTDQEAMVDQAVREEGHSG